MPITCPNPHRGTGIAGLGPMPLDDPKDALALVGQCPAYQPTALTDHAGLAAQVGVARVWVKDERTRMGLGSFKALGAAHMIARDAMAAAPDGPDDTTLAGKVYVAASAGNHGLSVAAGARVFGATAMIYLAASVPEAFADRLRAQGATVVRAGDIYEESMAAAEQAAATHGYQLLSDSTWPGYTEPALRVMEGYLIMASEIASQIDAPPSHILLQAGVGGLATAMAAAFRVYWGDAPTIIVVEPEAAPALVNSIKAGEITTTQGPVSAMGRLDCKTPSMVALAGLARDADRFVTLTEAEADSAMAPLAGMDLATTPSGGAGLAALMAGLDLPADATVLTILSEGPEDG